MKTALLLIHGFLTCTDDWDLLKPELEPLYDHIELFVQPGHERADSEDDPQYEKFSCQSAYDKLNATMDGLEKEYDAIDVVGHSMGGAMALYIAGTRKIRRAVFLSPSLYFPRLGVFTRHHSIVKRLNELKRHINEERLADQLDKSTVECQDSYKMSWDVFKKRLIPYWSIRNINTLFKISRKGKAEIKKITCPFAILWGNLDEFIPEKAVKTIIKHTASRSKTSIIYEDVGHAMMYVKSWARIARDIKAFLSGNNPVKIKDIPETELRTAINIEKKKNGMRDIYGASNKIYENNGIAVFTREEFRREENEKTLKKQ